MKLLLFRLAGSAIALLTGCFLFDVMLPPRGFILCVIAMALLYTFLRPLMNVVILPFNMLSFGIVGIFADALLVMWASGGSFRYLQAVLIAAIAMLCYLPYGRYKRFRV